MRDAAINLRARPEQRELIDPAAQLLGKNRSDFMLEAACDKAQSALLEHELHLVVADEDGRVCGYYAMAAGAVSHQTATSGIRCKLPDPVPVMVLARLGVDRRTQGQHLGASLLQDAVNRAVAASQDAGVGAAGSSR